MVERRLTKSSSDRMIAGVCGGIARQFEIDSTWVRLIFVLLLFAGGSGLLIYLVLAIVMPPDRETSSTGGTPSDASALPPSPEYIEQRNRRNTEIIGLILVVIGLLFLVGNMGLFSWLRWSVVWPVVLILAGFFLLVRRFNR